VTFVDFVRGLFRPRIVIVRPEEMSEKAIDEALAATPETHPLYRAFMQLIDQAEMDAQESAGQDVNLPNSLAGHVVAARYLRELRRDIVTRRQRARKSQSPAGNNPSSKML
jgi:hypothetical protein